jgi:hypothetical protein
MGIPGNNDKTAGATRLKTGIYVREGNEYVGPFLNNADAEVFLGLIELQGESVDGIEIVEVRETENAGQITVTTVEKRSVLLSRTAGPTAASHKRPEMNTETDGAKPGPGNAKGRKSK